eukprot:349763-Chlamydomonas_euryale.AAC.1
MSRRDAPPRRRAVGGMTRDVTAAPAAATHNCLSRSSHAGLVCPRACPHPVKGPGKLASCVRLGELQRLQLPK